MGYVYVKGLIINPKDRSRQLELDFIADTGAIYTMVPAEILKDLEVVPEAKRRFKLADGEVKEFPVGEVRIRVEGIEVTTLIVFGREGSSPLLGVTTLELMGLQVDPTTGKLKPMDLMLLNLAPVAQAGNTRNVVGGDRMEAILSVTTCDKCRQPMEKDQRILLISEGDITESGEELTFKVSLVRYACHLDCWDGIEEDI